MKYPVLFITFCILLLPVWGADKFTNNTRLIGIEAKTGNKLWDSKDDIEFYISKGLNKNNMKDVYIAIRSKNSRYIIKELELSKSKKKVIKIDNLPVLLPGHINIYKFTEREVKALNSSKGDVTVTMVKGFKKAG